MDGIPDSKATNIAESIQSRALVDGLEPASPDNTIVADSERQSPSPFGCLSELVFEEECSYSGTEQVNELTEKKPMGIIVRSKVAIETMIFNRYFYVHYDGSRLMHAKRTLSGFNIYSSKDGQLLGKMRANVFGTKYTLDPMLEIKYETSFLDRGKPRSFKVRLEGLELTNKKPYFNTETNSFSLNFSGRVTKPSVKNFQVIHPLEPTYITLTFGKEENDSYILDFAHPWSALNAFCVGLSALDHKFGCD